MCEHVVCRLARRGCIVTAPTEWGSGGPVGAEVVPPDRIAEVQALLDQLDADALRTALGIERNERIAEQLAKICVSEQFACRATQCTTGVESRAAGLLDKLAAIKTADDLKRRL